MKNRKSSVNVLTALLLTALTATPALAQGNAAPVPPSTQAQGGRTLGGTRSAAPQLTLRYYAADPLKGGRSLTTRSVTPDGLRAALSNPPQGARYAVLSGGPETHIPETRIIDLSDSVGLAAAGGEAGTWDGTAVVPPRSRAGQPRVRPTRAVPVAQTAVAQAPGGVEQIGLAPGRLTSAGVARRGWAGEAPGGVARWADRSPRAAPSPSTPPTRSAGGGR